MEGIDFATLFTQEGPIWTFLVRTAEDLLRPWRYYQLIMIAACFVLAHLLSPTIRRWIEAGVRQREHTRQLTLRIVVLLVRHMRMIVFVLLMWLTIFALSFIELTRDDLLVLAANIGTAWVFIVIVTRLIRNQLLRTIVRWSVWSIVTIRLLGLMPEAVELLDSAAINLGSTRLSLLLIVKAAISLAVFIALAGWLSRALGRRLDRVEDISPSMKVLTDKLLKMVIYAIAIIFGLQTIGFDLTSLTVLSGAIGLGLGFGLQKVVSNLVSGVILLLDKSIKPGDVISLGETFGWISSLGARYVSVITRDGREYLIPNEDLITGQVVNWSHSSDLVRLDIFFGVAYASDPHEVRKIAREAAASVDRVVASPAPVCHIVGFGDSSIDLILRFWIRDPTGGLTNVRGNVYLALWDALKAAEVEIPFPRRDVHVYGDQKDVPVD